MCIIKKTCSYQLPNWVGVAPEKMHTHCTLRPGYRATGVPKYHASTVKGLARPPILRQRGLLLSIGNVSTDKQAGRRVKPPGILAVHPLCQLCILAHNPRVKHDGALTFFPRLVFSTAEPFHNFAFYIFRCPEAFGGPQGQPAVTWYSQRFL